MTNEPTNGINEWTCGTCAKHIVAGDPLLRVTYAIDRAGPDYLFTEPEMLLGDEYCSPECAINGTLTMLRRLAGHQLVMRAFRSDNPAS